MTKIVIIHGNGGCTGNDVWIPWLKRELEKHKVKVLTPTMPDNFEAKGSVWLPYMKNVLQCDEKTVVIGHSSGAVAAMRYAEQNKLLGSVLVGACYTDLGYESERISGYYDTPWQWEKIKNNQSWIVQLASQDDPFIPVQEARYISKQLGSEYYEFGDQGHFQNREVDEMLRVVLEKI